MTGEPTPGDERAALRGLGDAARSLLALEADATLADTAIAPVRAETLARYRAYVERFGPLNRGELREGRVDPQTGEPVLRWHRPDLGGFRRDPDYLTVMALEVFDQRAGSAGPAPILLRRVHGRGGAVAGAVNADEALLIARAEGTVDLGRIARLLGLPDAAAAGAALGERIVADPEHGTAPVAVDDYLSGDVRARLATARGAAATDERYRRNVDLLTAVQPAEVGAPDIAVSLGAPWIDAADVEAFIHEVLGGRARVWHLPSAAFWKIVPEGKEPAGRFSTSRMSAYELLTHGLNGRTPVVIDRVAGPVPGKRVARRNVEQTIAAHDRLLALQDAFAEWLWRDGERTERLVAEYNRRFTAHRPRRGDGSRLTFPGLADGLELWPWQRDIVARALTAPATLCAHAVGAGKTRSMAVVALTARRLGLARKPLVTVPAHLVEQTAREFRQAYPFGRFLVVGEDGAASRARLAAHCATGDWDAVIVSHGVFSAVPVAPEAERAWLRERIAAAEAEIRGGRGGRYGRTVLRRRVAGLQTRLDRLDLLDEAAAPALTFDTLGIDLLLVDEAHYFKRLPITSRREGISLGSSHRAADLHRKAQLLRRRRGSRPSLVLFTGTPWSNTIAETFVWQTLVQPDRLAAAGIETFDAWAAVFVDYDDHVEVAPDSAGFRIKQRPSRIRNLPELRTMLADAAELRSGDALGLTLPARRDDTVVCPASPRQRAYVAGLELRADKIRRTRTHGVRGEDNMLALCGDGRRAALDPRLVGVPEDSSKIAAAAERVARVHAEHRAARFPGSDHSGVLQIVFCDQGTPGTDGPQTYGRLRRALVARGLPADQVRWVHDARTPAERAALFAACRDGAVSVLLGSTDTLGTGANVQNRLRAIHHLDAPWRPSDIEQREGRALRPGNHNDSVDVIRYVTRGTFDGYMWQTLERKARFIAQLHRGMRDADPGPRIVDDLGEAVLGFAEVKALATGNPLLLEEARAAADVARLRVLRSLDAHAVTAARAALAAAEQEHYRLTQQRRQLRSAQARTGAAGSGAEDGVRATVAALVARIRHPDPTAPAAPLRVGWAGLGVELVPAGGWRTARPDSLVVRVTLAHRPVDEFTVPTRAGRRAGSVADEQRVITALRRWRRRLDERIGEVEAAIEDLARRAATAQATISDHRFDRAGELADAQRRLALIRTTLEAAVDDLATEERDSVGGAA